jgi:hypothetical protein
LGTAFIAAVPHHALIRACLDAIPRRMTLAMPIWLQTGPGLVTEIVRRAGDATVSVLHSSYFYPIPYGHPKQKPFLIHPTSRTMGIHRWAESWKQKGKQWQTRE